MLIKSILLSSSIILFANPLALVSTEDKGDINKKDNQGRKQGLWIYYGKDRPELGYPFTGKVEEGEYKNDRREGFWIKYYKDGITPRLKGEYSNNRPNGDFIKNYPNGKIKEVGTFKRNRYLNSLKRFYENGSIKYEANFNENGKEQGQVKYLYPNGHLEFIYEAQNGIPIGKASRFYENGDVKEIIYYADDGSVEKSEERKIIRSLSNISEPIVSKEKELAPKVLNAMTKGSKFQTDGYNKVYNMHDEIWQDGEFINGRLWTGKVYEYDQDGILLKVKVFKKGLYNSDGQL